MRARCRSHRSIPLSLAVLVLWGCDAPSSRGAPAPAAGSGDARPAPQPGQAFTNSIGMKLVWIPPAIPPAEVPRSGPAPEPARIREWITRLDDDDHAIREEATRALEGAGVAAEEALREALGHDPPPEAKSRIEELVQSLEESKSSPFLMGSPPDEAGREDDETRHRVRLTKGFWLGATEVTQAQWRAVMGTEPSRFKGDDLPVEQVSRDDAVEFCRKLSEREGRRYRLPTEAEWEWACRAGTATRFSFGDADAGLAEYGWYSDNSNGATHAVGGKKPNAWGLHDMHGNVWEWCEDRYGPYPEGDATDPTGSATGDARVLRGGSWYYDPRRCRSARRLWVTPGNRDGRSGFRLALDSP